MRDEAGRARVRIARDAGGNQTRQAGLDDTENKMAMAAGNAKVHGDFRQRKGRASAAVVGSCRRAGDEQAEREHPAECRRHIEVFFRPQGV